MEFPDEEEVKFSFGRKFSLLILLANEAVMSFLSNSSCMFIWLVSTMSSFADEGLLLPQTDPVEADGRLHASILLIPPWFPPGTPVVALAHGFPSVLAPPPSPPDVPNEVNWPNGASPCSPLPCGPPPGPLTARILPSVVRRYKPFCVLIKVTVWPALMTGPDDWVLTPGRTMSAIQFLKKRELQMQGLKALYDGGWINHSITTLYTCDRQRVTNK